MKRFIDIKKQVNLDGPKQFAFYCTARNIFESFNDKNLWMTENDFIRDYIVSGGDDLERYISLMPNEGWGL